MKSKLAFVLCAALVAVCAIGAPTRAAADEAPALTKLDLGNFYAFWTDWEGAATATLAAGSDETYSFDDRRWNGLPSVCLTEGGRLWAGFMTGGYGEPDPLNYNAFHYSDDGGKTWSEESLVIDQKDEEKKVYQPHLFMHDGVMYMYLNNAGQNVITVENPDCDDPSRNLKLSKATKVLNYNSAHRPTILSEKWDNIWLFSAENSSSDSNAIYASTNGRKWEQYSTVNSSNGSRRWWEAQIVECADGSLIHISRLENGADGGLQLSRSYDGGESWTDTQANNGRPFLSFSNKPHLQRLDSGNLLLIVACSTTARENLTAFLSEDNGKTWPYSLSLDARDHFGDWFGCGYPEAANRQGENGEIYVVWDARFSYAEIACAKFTEADIKAGRIVTDGCFTYDTVVRNRALSGAVVADITGVKETFDKYVTVPVGTSAAGAAAKLPARLTAVTAGGEVTCSGEWRCPDYDGQTPGRYVFRLNTPDLPSDTGDSYGYLTAVVTVEPEKKSGCGSSAAAAATPVAVGFAAAGLAGLKRRKKYEKNG